MNTNSSSQGQNDTKPSAPEMEFDVALSFAGEDRGYVEKTADVLRRMGLRVFYDKYEQVSLWGKNLYDHLSLIYGKTSRFTVIFVSQHYARKLWTNLERQSAQARAFAEKQEYILPARLDDTAIPGILPTIGYLDLRKLTPAELAEFIKKKIGPILRDKFFPDQPDRLYEFLGVTTSAEKRTIVEVARDVLSSLSLMTDLERRVIAAASMHGCPSGPLVEEDIHININLLGRLVGLDRRRLLALFSRLECLSFRHKLSSHGKKSKTKDILHLTYEPMFLDDELSGNWTPVLDGMIRCVSGISCDSCSADAIARLDFSVLSTLAGYSETHSAVHESTKTIVDAHDHQAPPRSRGKSVSLKGKLTRPTKSTSKGTAQNTGPRNGR